MFHTVRNLTVWVSCVAVMIAAAAAAPALADAWGAFWGRVDGIVTPNDPDSILLWNTDPAN